MPIKPPVNQIWIAYNHIPGGQIVAMHFEDIVRNRKEGDGTIREILIPSKDQLEGFKKSDQVAVNVKGRVTKREVLVFQGPDLSRDKNAADRVIAWAKEQGLEPIYSKAEKDALPSEHTRRLNEVEGRLSMMEQNVGKILALLEKK